MLDLTVIILTKDESIHIRRAIENVRPISRRIIIVDSFSSDATVAIAREAGAEVFEHTWPGNQAEQFNWALDNLDISTKWILRLDADEYLTDELIAELEQKLPYLPENVTSLSLSRARVFAGKRLRHGIVNSVDIIRIFRRGTARYEARIMDEHLKILQGDTIQLKHQFVDHNLMSMSNFIAKHDGYAIREAALLLDQEYGLSANPDSDKDLGEKASKKRRQKSVYARMPLFWRAAAYFFYRHFIRLGFLDGKAGFQWDFFQGWWYRTLVDAKIYEIKKQCGNDAEKIKAHLRDNYNIVL